MSASISNPMSFPRRVAALLKYWYRFGGLGGTRVFWQAMLGGTSARPRRLSLPGAPAALLVRPGSSDLPTFEKVFVDQEYNFDLPGLEPELIIDAGANVGYASLFFVRRFPKARVVAIEPEAENFKMLTDNTRAYPQVQPLQAALWNRPARMAIANPDAESWEFQVREAEGGSGGLRAVTIPELLKMAGCKRVSVLKIDIEGAEKELFSSGYEEWLGLVDLIIIELHDRYRAGCSSTFYRALAGYEFGQFPVGENVFVTLNVKGQS